MSGGFQKPLTSASSQLIADQIRGNYKLLMSIVEERDMPLLMNDTIFKKVINDSKRYLQSAVKHADRLADSLVFVHSSMLKQVCFG